MASKIERQRRRPMKVHGIRLGDDDVARAYTIAAILRQCSPVDLPFELSVTVRFALRSTLETLQAAKQEGSTNGQA